MQLLNYLMIPRHDCGGSGQNPPGFIVELTPQHWFIMGAERFPWCIDLPCF
jgi:hypothetical protein